MIRSIPRYQKLLSINLIFIIGHLVFLVLAFYPAIMTPDSIDTFSQIDTGRYSNWHPVIYTLFVQLLSFNGSLPVIVVISQFFLLNFAFGYFLYSLNSTLSANFILFTINLLLFIPYFSIFPISIWKDIPFAAITLIGLATVNKILSIKQLEANKNVSILLPVVLLALGSAFRHNGWAILVIGSLIAGVMFLLKKSINYKLIRDVFILSAGASIVISFMLTLAVKAESNPSYIKFLPLIHDIKISNDLNDKYSNDLVLFSETINSTKIGFDECSNSGVILYNGTFNAEYAEQVTNQIPIYWLKALAQSPATLTKVHFCRVQTFLPPPLSNGPGYISWFAYDIAPNALGYATTPVFSELRNISLSISAFWLDHAKLFVWIGLYSLLTTIIFLAVRLTHPKQKEIYLPAFIYSIATLVFLIVASPGQEARYGYIIILIFFAFLVNFTQGKIKKFQ